MTSRTPIGHARRLHLALKTPVLFIFSLVVVLFIAAISLHQSLESGKLSVPPDYDDVVYLYWSQLVLQAAPHQHVLNTAYQILDQHSPLTTLFGFIGYSLIKAGDIGPYIVALSHLILFVFACVLVLRRLPAMAIIGIACGISAIPVMRNFVTEFRPEPAWASLTAISVMAIFAVDIFEGARIKQIGLGLLVGLAVISKPTTSPYTIVVLGAAFLASALAHYQERRVGGSPPPLRVLVTGAATLWAAALLVIVPIGAIIGREIYDYLLWVARDISDQTASRAGFADQMLFYSFGFGGQLMLGRALPVLLAIWGLSFGYAAVSRRSALPRIFALFVVVLISYAIPSATVVKLMWFGSAFDAIFITTTVYLIALLYEPFAESSSHPGARAIISSLVGVAGIGLLLVSNLRGEPSGISKMDGASRAELTERTARIWSVLRDRELVRLQSAPSDHISNVMTIAVRPIVGTLVSLYSAKEGLPMRNLELAYAHTLDELMVKLSEVDYVVVEPSFEHSLRGAGLGNSLIDAMNLRPDFFLVASIPLHEPDTVAKIYERRVL